MVKSKVSDEEETVVVSPKEKVKAEESMESLVADAGEALIPFHVGEVSDVTVLSTTKGSIWVDVLGVAIGVIPEREFSYGTQDLKVGDTVSAYVLSLEDKEGHVVLSLRRADRERLWVTLKDKFESGEVIQGKVVEANKGGLMVEVGGVVGFLPISQLSSNHYPRQAGANRDELAHKLGDLINETLNIKIINFDKITNKLIFSEKAAGDSAVEEKLSKIAVGSTVKGRITGIVDFGLFVAIGDGVEGLVHISEVSWKRVSDLRTLYSVGDEIEVSVTGVADGKVSLSAKRLTIDPWIESATGFKVGEVISGTVTQVKPFGVFVKMNETIDGLVHISELSDDRVEDPGTILSIGQTKQFKVISIDPQAHRISLSLKAVAKQATDDTEKPPKVKEPAKPTKHRKKAEVVSEKATV